MKTSAPLIKAPSAQPASTSVGQWTPRYTRETPTSSATPTASGPRPGRAHPKIPAAAAVSVACAEGNDCPEPQPRGATTALSTAQGRARPARGFTSRTESTSPSPIEAQSSTAASTPCGDRRQRWIEPMSAAATRTRRLDAASMTKSSQGVPGRLKNASTSRSMSGAGTAGQASTQTRVSDFLEAPWRKAPSAVVSSS